MISDGEGPSKFWRPQDVWIARRRKLGVRNPGQLNRSWREPEPSKLSDLGDQYEKRRTVNDKERRTKEWPFNDWKQVGQGSLKQMNE